MKNQKLKIVGWQFLYLLGMGVMFIHFQIFKVLFFDVDLAEGEFTLFLIVIGIFVGSSFLTGFAMNYFENQIVKLKVKKSAYKVSAKFIDGLIVHFKTSELENKNEVIEITEYYFDYFTNKK